MNRELIILLFAATVCSFASDRVSLMKTRPSQVDAPVAGYAVEGTSVRPLVGLPGLLRWSEPFALPSGFSRFVVAPGQQFALALGEAGAVTVFLFDGGQLRAAARIDAGAAVSEVVFSPSGSAAALLSTNGRAVIVTGLPLEAKRGGSWDDATKLIAISDDGSAGIRSDGRGAGSLSAVNLGEVTAAAFYPRSGKLLASRVDGSVFHFEKGAAGQVLEAGAIAGVRQALVSESGQSAFLSTPERLWRLNLATGELHPELVQPGNGFIQRMRSRDTLLVKDENGTTVVSVRADGVHVEALAVPAIQ